MADLLKNILNRDLVKNIGQLVKQSDRNFDEQKFLKLVMSPDWPTLELKQRIRHISQALSQTIDHPFPQQIVVLKKVAPHVRGLSGLIFPDFVDLCGQQYVSESIAALKFFTPFSSSEFAIRSYIKKHPQKLMSTLLKWTQDNDEHVRRLASEGCRPRLPWSFPLADFKKDPTDVIKILEKLKDDPSLYVRKSVANNLNDISKDHPELVLNLAQKWIGVSENTDWILKHALRTRLKKGDQKALALFGLKKVKNVSCSNLKFEKKVFPIGTHLEFSFDLVNKNTKNTNLRLEYAIHYLTKNGKASKKVFKISEKIFTPGKFQIRRRHSLKQMTTRKHYPGQHHLEIIVNGEAYAKQAFIIK